MEGENSEWFRIETRLKQGCILSPAIIYNIVLDYTCTCILRRLEKFTEWDPTPFDKKCKMQSMLMIGSAYIPVGRKHTEANRINRCTERRRGKLGLRINTKKTKITE